MLDDLTQVIDNLPVAVRVCEAPGGAIRRCNLGLPDVHLVKPIDPARLVEILHEPR
jgi:hypothetical protein